MPCGTIILQDPSSKFWLLNCTNFGVPLTVSTPATFTNYTAPLLNSPSFTWQLSAGLDGGIIQTPVGAQSAPTFYTLQSVNLTTVQLTIGDDGELVASGVSTPNQGFFPFPTDVSMSLWPPTLNLQSSIAGASPLTVGADMSIWSCVLNRFINEDTTNIIVVLDE